MPVFFRKFWCRLEVKNPAAVKPIISNVNLTAPTDTSQSDDHILGVEPELVVTQLGDIWRLGNHCPICGDAQNAETYAN